MATKFILKKENGLMKEGIIGFSWTCLFFGPFVPLLRGDYLNALVSLVLNIMCGAGNLYYSFVYNKMYTKNLIEKEGYRISGTDEQINLYKAKLGVNY